jgi:hypothetical protein
MCALIRTRKDEAFYKLIDLRTNFYAMTRKYVRYKQKIEDRRIKSKHEIMVQMHIADNILQGILRDIHHYENILRDP